MNFSILTCTHNPEIRIFDYLYHAISALQVPGGMQCEWIIVDNGSRHNSLSGFDFSEVPFPVHLLTVPEPGLTGARIRGIHQARWDWIIFFDDDNEPSPRYVREAAELISEHRDVGCWGPGRIEVNFHQEKPASWLSQFADRYQERRADKPVIQEDQVWNPDFPQGTGLIMRKDLLLAYAEEVVNGTYSLTDRSGSGLLSGGDVQMVLHAVKSGSPAGISPALEMIHHISEKKCRFRYLFHLTYGLTSSSLLAHHQVFNRQMPAGKTISNTDVFTLLFNFLRQYKGRIFSKRNRLVLAERMGNVNAHFLLFPDIKKPWLFRWMEKLLFHV